MSESATPQLLNRPESYPPEHLKVTHLNTRKLPTWTHDIDPSEDMYAADSANNQQLHF